MISLIFTVSKWNSPQSIRYPQSRHVLQISTRFNLYTPTYPNPQIECGILIFFYYSWRGESIASTFYRSIEGKSSTHLEGNVKYARLSNLLKVFLDIWIFLNTTIFFCFFRKILSCLCFSKGLHLPIYWVPSRISKHVLGILVGKYL